MAKAKCPKCGKTTGRTALARYRTADGEWIEKQVPIPKVLYHGTLLSNLDSIKEKGLLMGMPQRKMSQEMHPEDQGHFVSFSPTIKETIMYAMGYEYGDHVVLEIDTSKLNPAAMVFTPMFESDTGEAVYILNVPPDAIKRALVRKFVNGKIKEEWIDV